MDREPITYPRVNARVWTVHGLHQHGPMEGPKTDVPADTGGRIIGTEKPYYTMDQLLYVVRWDTGETTKHYFKELFVIGPFEDFATFSRALVSATEVSVTLGPQGGFRGAEFSVSSADGSVLLRYEQEQRSHWEIVRPILEQVGVEIRETRLAPKRRMWVRGNKSPRRDRSSSLIWATPKLDLLPAHMGCRNMRMGILYLRACS